MAFKDITAAIDEGFDDMVEDDTCEADAMEDVDSAPVELPVDPEEGDVKVTHSHNSHVCTFCTLQRQQQHVMTIHHKLPRYLHNCVLMQAPPEEDSGDEEASDSKGIHEWDRVDALAEALLSLSGMAATTE